MRPGRMRAIGVFIAAGILYFAWMTGFSFEFHETRVFPNYDLLAEAFSKGRLHLEQTPPDDTLLKDGRRYIFSGPVPALLRLPFKFLFKLNIPTGLMIVIFCAGTGALFAWSLDELSSPPEKKRLTFARNLIAVLFVLNGVSLYMVTIPSLHHESICIAMFFLTLAIVLFLRIKNRNYRVSSCAAVLMGLSLSLAIGSRFSYIFAAVALGAMLTIGMLRRYRNIPRQKIIGSLSIIAGICTVSIALLLWYNYGRFGAFFDFGMQYLVSFYKAYFAGGGYFRYDHFHYNFWALFFQAPQFVPEFPFLLLPRYVLQVQSIGLTPYYLLHTNELTVSIFILMPVLVLAAAPLLTRNARTENGLEAYAGCGVILITQVLSFIFTVATIARYYYDILPLMMMMAYMGAAGFIINRKLSHPLLAFLAALSILISWALPLNAVKFYAQFIDYQSPLLNIFY